MGNFIGFKPTSTGRIVLKQDKSDKIIKDKNKPAYIGKIIFNDRVSNNVVIISKVNKEGYDTGLEYVYKVNPKSVSIIGAIEAWVLHVTSKKIKEWCKYVPADNFKNQIPGVYKYIPESEVLFQFVKDKNYEVNVISKSN